MDNTKQHPLIPAYVAKVYPLKQVAANYFLNIQEDFFFIAAWFPVLVTTYLVPSAGSQETALSNFEAARLLFLKPLLPWDVEVIELLLQQGEYRVNELDFLGSGGTEGEVVDITEPCVSLVTEYDLPDD